MSDILLALFPLIALIATGYFFKKQHFFSEGFWSGAEKLNYYVLFPALLLHTLATAKIDPHSLKTVITAMLIVLTIATFGLYVSRFLKHTPPARFGVHVQSIVRFNTYIGLALVAALYQKEGLAILVILLAVSVPVVNIISVLALTPHEHMSLKPVVFALLKNPLILSCMLGGALNALHIPIWEGLINLMKLFSASSLPLGLLCVGAALQFMEMKKDVPALVFDTLARLVLMPAFAYVVCLWLGLSKLESQITVIFFSLPTASAAYILTKVLRGDSQLMAAIISFQTLLSALTLPAVIWWVG